MRQTKEFIEGFLKESGAAPETIAKFNEVYDNDIQEAMHQEAQGSLYQSREEVSTGLQNISDMANRYNLRNK